VSLALMTSFLSIRALTRLVKQRSLTLAAVSGDQRSESRSIFIRRSRPVSKASFRVECGALCELAETGNRFRRWFPDIARCMSRALYATAEYAHPGCVS